HERPIRRLTSTLATGNLHSDLPAYSGYPQSHRRPALAAGVATSRRTFLECRSSRICLSFYSSPICFYYLFALGSRHCPAPGRAGAMSSPVILSMKEIGVHHATVNLSPLFTVLRSRLGGRGRAEKWRPADGQDRANGQVESRPGHGPIGQDLCALERRG